MGVFGNLFGSKEKEEKRELPWIPLTSKQQLVGIRDRSKSRPQFIFKHSTTCGISRMVLGMFTNNYPFDKEGADLYFLDLHAFREISNEVAAVFQVFHESPQLIVIKNGDVIFHTSHGAIAETNLEEFK